ncbi:hypothetical protein [Flavobacterium hydrophilum]|nr:hypothetical protein [Flavobacterium hydrophilum]
MAISMAMTKCIEKEIKFPNPNSNEFGPLDKKPLQQNHNIIKPDRS